MDKDLAMHLARENHPWNAKRTKPSAEESVEAVLTTSDLKTNPSLRKQSVDQLHCKINLDGQDEEDNSLCDMKRV